MADGYWLIADGLGLFCG